MYNTLKRVKVAVYTNPHNEMSLVPPKVIAYESDLSQMSIVILIPHSSPP